MNQNKTVKMDAINRKILSTLHTQSNLTNQDLADIIALSPSACFQRTKALKEAGYFINFHTEMDLDRICEHVLAYVEFTLNSNTALGRKPFEQKIENIPEFMDCVRVGDEADYISFTCFSDVNALNEACDQLSNNLDLDIKRIKIRMILERAKWCLGYPIDKLKWVE